MIQDAAQDSSAQRANTWYNSADSGAIYSLQKVHADVEHGWLRRPLLCEDRLPNPTS
jgi:hypothetical protein